MDEPGAGILFGIFIGVVGGLVVYVVTLVHHRGRVRGHVRLWIADVCEALPVVRGQLEELGPAASKEDGARFLMRRAEEGKPWLAYIRGYTPDVEPFLLNHPLAIEPLLGDGILRLVQCLKIIEQGAATMRTWRDTFAIQPEYSVTVYGEAQDVYASIFSNLAEAERVATILEKATREWVRHVR